MSFLEFIDNIFQHSGDCYSESICNIRWELTEKSTSHTILGEGGYYLYVDLKQPNTDRLGSGLVPLVIKDNKLYTGWENQYPRYAVPADIAIEVLSHILETFSKDSRW